MQKRRTVLKAFTNMLDSAILTKEARDSEDTRIKIKSVRDAAIASGAFAATFAASTVACLAITSGKITWASATMGGTSMAFTGVGVYATFKLQGFLNKVKTMPESIKVKMLEGISADAKRTILEWKITGATIIGTIVVLPSVLFFASGIGKLMHETGQPSGAKEAIIGAAGVAASLYLSYRRRRLENSQRTPSG